MKHKSLKQWLSISIAISLTLFFVFLIIQQCDFIKNVLEQAKDLEEHGGDAQLFTNPFLLQYITRICEYAILIIVVNIPFILYFFDNKRIKDVFVLSTLCLSIIYCISNFIVCLNCLIGFNRKDYLSLTIIFSILIILSILCLSYYIFDLIKKNKQPKLS